MRKQEPTINKEDLEPLAVFINEMYNGDLCALNHHISEAVYMLHYVPYSTIDEQEKQSVCYVLNRIRECMNEVRETKSNTS